MDTFNLSLLSLVGLLFFLYLTGHFAFYFTRRAIKPRDELIPNQLMTCHPLLLLKPKSSGTYRGPYWNHLLEYLKEHGHDVVETSELPKSHKKFHVFFTDSEKDLAITLSNHYPDKIASLSFIHKTSSQAERLDRSEFKHHVKLIQIPKAKLYQTALVTAYESLSLGPQSKKDLLSLGNFQSDEYYENLLRHSSDLAAEDYYHD